MQKALTGLVLLFISASVCAQWQFVSPNTYFIGGNVGIGTNSPQFPLHVTGQIKATSINQVSFSTESDLGVVIQQGNIGGDHVNAQNYLSIFGHNLMFNGTNWIRRNMYGNTWANVMNQNYYDVLYAPSNSGGTMNAVVTPTTFLRIAPSGNVGIGTTNISDGGYKLFVETGIRTRKVVVDQATWPDYVFHPGYSLPSLPGVAAYIKANHRLPDMPSADSVARNGVDLGSNQAQLLKKIEELTLYVIRQQEEIDALKAAVNRPKK